LGDESEALNDEDFDSCDAVGKDGNDDEEEGEEEEST